MQFGILGLPEVGKTTLFNTLTASQQATDRFQGSRQTNVGVALVTDPRLVRLRDHYRPKEFTPATVTYVDIPGISKGEGAESLDPNRLREVDALGRPPATGHSGGLSRPGPPEAGRQGLHRPGRRDRPLSLQRLASRKI